MTVLVTGSSGHLGEALVRTLRGAGRDVTGLDVKAGHWTDVTGSVADRAVVRACLEGARVVYHAATLHKPHVVTHGMEAFVETNVRGTLALLEEAAAAGVESFVFTSTTSVFGEANRPAADRPAAWVTEATAPEPRNVYGVTKRAAEDLCRLVHRQQGLACLVLRTSRFFLEADDDAGTRARYEDANVKTNELLYRRVDLADVVDAHLLAAERAPSIGFGTYVVSATTPFAPGEAAELRRDAHAVVRRRVPGYEAVYESRGWRMFDGLDRVYVNAAARRDLGWQPRYDFAHALRRLAEGESPHSELALAVGKKGYHETTFEHGPYPVEEADRPS